MPLFNIWGSTVPNQLDQVGAFCVGHTFQSSVAGNVVGVRFYKSTNDTGTHIGSLWTTGGSHLGTVTFTGETATGWQSMNFASPIAISAATNYVVTVTHATRLSNNNPCPAKSGIFTPLSSGTTAGSFIAGSADVFPTTVNQPFWYGLDVIFDDLSNFPAPTGVGSGGLGVVKSEAAVVGYLRGICIGGMTSIEGEAPFGRHLQVGVLRSNAEGSPATPSLLLCQPGQWRFRWAVHAGARSISVLAKQGANVAPHPSMIVKSNPAIGVNADVSASSPGGTGWQTIGPISVSPSSDGALWVELWNNDKGTYNPSNGNVCPANPAFFDHLIFT